MANVYRDFDPRLKTDVAVKVIRTDNIPPNILERSMKRFEREAKALARQCQDSRLCPRRWIELLYPRPPQALTSGL